MAMMHVRRLATQGITGLRLQSVRQTLHVARPKSVSSFQPKFINLRMSQARSYMTSSTRRRLAQLEEEANNSPSDAFRQARFLRELNVANQSSIVVRRCESGRFARSEDVNREYMRAIAAANPSQSYGGSSQSYNQPFGGTSSAYPSMNMGAASGAAMSSSGAGGNPENPMHVVMVPESGKAALVRFLRTALLMGGAYFLLTQFLNSKGGGSINPMSQMTKKVIPEPQTEDPVQFDDVQGVDEVKASLKQVVEYLRNPDKFTKLGGKLPKGVLLQGPPGTGKTLLAKAVAGEADVPFFYASGSEFEEMFVGVGARRVRDLFEAAKLHAPCVVFIDEVDAIGSKRNPRDQQAVKMTLNQLLVELDGFKTNTGVIVIAATNFPETLDKALVRPGRFDQKVNVGLPDIAGRKAILQLYVDKVAAAKDIDVPSIARATPGFSGAALSNLINSAALLAASEGCNAVTMRHVEEAKDTIIMGSPRKIVMSKEEVDNTAYHEAGHAIVAALTEGAAPIRKATILPRGQALGMVSLENMSEISQTRKQLIAQMDVCMGGRIGEELRWGKDNVTTGAMSDFDSATNIARAMVLRYGMGEAVSIASFNAEEARVNMSPETKQAIDQEVQQLLRESYARTRALMVKNQRAWERIGKGLLEYETISGEEVKQLIKGRKLNREAPAPKPPPAAKSKTTQTEATQVPPLPGKKAAAAL